MIRFLLSWRGGLLLLVLILLGLVPVIAAQGASLGIPAAVVALFGLLLPVLTMAYYYGVFAMSWDLVFGFAGEVNFGPTFLIGLGAYTAGLLNNAGWSIPICAVAGACMALAGGVLLALPALRLRGPYFGLTTLVAVLLLQNFIVIFAGFTGGEIGMTTSDVLSADPGVNYWYAFGFALISGVILTALSRSPLGLILQATGQDPIGAQALGFHVAKHKLAAFCVSAIFSGLAGALLVFYLGSASVDAVIDIAVGVQVIIAAVLGGRRTILGAAIGAIFLLVVGELLRPLGQLSTFIVSAIALAVILLFPDGLLGAFLRRGDA
jgi:branched-chain amino acid transport system permease protein